MAAMKRRPVLPRIVALTALAVGVYRFGHRGAAYSVRGRWEGDVALLKDTIKGDLGHIAHGLEPQVSFPEVSYGRDGVTIGVADGHLSAQYASQLEGGTKLKVGVNDEQAWSAGLDGEGASLRVRGQGADPNSIFWEAAQSSQVDDLGDVKVEFNSGKEYNFTVARENLAELAGVRLGARARAANEGVAARLAARRALRGGGEASYAVENPVGVYELGRAQHDLRLRTPVAGGEASVGFEGDAAVQAYRGSYTRGVAGGLARVDVSREVDAEDVEMHYDASYSRGLSDVLKLDSKVQVGIDDGGAYGSLAAARPLARGVSAEYQARARLGLADEEHRRSFAHSLKLSNKLGYAQLAHGNGEPPRLKVGYDFEA